MSTSFLPYALSYAEAGYVVLQLKPLTNEPLGIGGMHFCDCTRCGPSCTHPLIGSTDPDVLTKWWTDEPAANIGVVTGCRSRLLVVDIDQKSGQRGGASWVNFLYESKVELPNHPYARTPTGGVHRWFGLPPDTHVKTKLSWLQHVDAKACGGQVAVPPSGRVVNLPDMYTGEPLDYVEEYEWEHTPGVPPVPGLLLEDVQTRPPYRTYGRSRTGLYGGAGTDSGSPQLPPTSEFKLRGFGWFTGSRDQDCYRLAWRLWGQCTDERAVLAELRRAWEVTDQAQNGHPFRWDEAVKCARSAGERFRANGERAAAVYAAWESGGTT